MKQNHLTSWKELHRALYDYWYGLDVICQCSLIMAEMKQPHCQQSNMTFSYHMLCVHELWSRSLSQLLCCSWNWIPQWLYMALKLIQSFSVYNNQSVHEYEMKICERYCMNLHLNPVCILSQTDVLPHCSVHHQQIHTVLQNYYHSL